jgi:hypothetical protein
MLAILFIISSLGYPEEGFVFMLANPSPGYPKEEMMKNKANINTNPSSGYQKRK